MIEYANESVIKLLKQYDMFSRSLEYTMDMKQKNDICDEMTKIIQNVLEITNSIYEDKFKRVEQRSVYLMSEERTRLLELINLVNERRAYVNNQVASNKELTGIGIDATPIMGEEKLEEYKQQVKIIERYKSNIKLEEVLKEEIKNLDVSIKKANDKISNNQNLNRQLEEKMIYILGNAIKKLSLYELVDRRKEIDLAYTELGYSLEKAKENAKIARHNYSEEIVLECDNMLASITLEYERYKEKKLILNLIEIYQKNVSNYKEMLEKREEINNILMNITDSELYKMVGNELNKEYATIKLEQQDMATLKSLTEEREIKSGNLSDIIEENNSKELKGLLANLLENEKKYQEKIILEKKKQEQKKLEQIRLEEERKQKEIARRQQALEEERKKEIERRTKQLLVEKKNPILNAGSKANYEQEMKEKATDFCERKSVGYSKKDSNTVKEKKTPLRSSFNKEEKIGGASFQSGMSRTSRGQKLESTNSFKETEKSSLSNQFMRDLPKNQSVLEKGIPVIKQDNLENKVVAAKGVDNEQGTKKVFPDIPLEKKEDIFPSFPEINKSNSFFDENEFKDLSNYMEDSEKKSWF